MNSRKKQKLALEQQLQNRTPNSDDCPYCKMQFPSKLNREAHRMRYPSHFTETQQ